MRNRIKFATLALAASGLLAGAVPANAATAVSGLSEAPAGAAASTWNHGRGRGHGHGGHGGYRGHYGESSYDDRGGYDRGYYDGPVWRGNDGRYRCRRNDGTTGLLIGGVAGGLLGREVAGRHGDRTAGFLLGAVGGALVGRAIDRNGSSCR